jgi:Ulp1 protease family, C-terminal catalytic domain
MYLYLGFFAVSTPEKSECSKGLAGVHGRRPPQKDSQCTGEGEVCQGAFFSGTHPIFSHSYKVPVQNNTWDCGIFTIHFAEVFMKDPDKYCQWMTVSVSLVYMLLLEHRLCIETRRGSEYHLGCERYSWPPVQASARDHGMRD